MAEESRTVFTAFWGCSACCTTWPTWTRSTPPTPRRVGCCWRWCAARHTPWPRGCTRSCPQGGLQGAAGRGAPGRQGPIESERIGREVLAHVDKEPDAPARAAAAFTQLLRSVGLGGALAPNGGLTDSVFDTLVSPRTPRCGCARTCGSTPSCAARRRAARRRRAGGRAGAGRPQVLPRLLPRRRLSAPALRRLTRSTASPRCSSSCLAPEGPGIRARLAEDLPLQPNLESTFHAVNRRTSLRGRKGFDRQEAKRCRTSSSPRCLAETMSRGGIFPTRAIARRMTQPPARAHTARVCFSQFLALDAPCCVEDASVYERVTEASGEWDAESRFNVTVSVELTGPQTGRCLATNGTHRDVRKRPAVPREVRVTHSAVLGCRCCGMPLNLRVASDLLLNSSAPSGQMTVPEVPQLRAATRRHRCQLYNQRTLSNRQSAGHRAPLGREGDAHAASGPRELGIVFVRTGPAQPVSIPLAGTWWTRPWRRQRWAARWCEGGDGGALHVPPWRAWASTTAWNWTARKCPSWTAAPRPSPRSSGKRHPRAGHAQAAGHPQVGVRGGWRQAGLADALHELPHQLHHRLRAPNASRPRPGLAADWR